MTRADLLAIFERISRPRLLVLGDLILDRYTFGAAERVSQEAPVILLRAEEREERLGGAANVCNMIRGLEAEVACAGVVGDDADGKVVRRLLDDSGVDTLAVIADPTRPTTVKERFIGRAQGRHPHQILRVDSETRDPIRPAVAAKLLDRILPRIADFDAVLVSDYDKGVCSEATVQAVIEAAHRAGLPVIVDPIRLPTGATDGYSRYRGATTMTPNRLEAELATGVKITTTDDALLAARKLIDAVNLKYAVVTLDREGMALAKRNGHGEVFPTRQRAVYDITGAGDMVLAMLGVCLASGSEPEVAVKLGNVAGGLEVERVGCVPITRDEIRAELRMGRGAADEPSVKIVTRAELPAIAKAHRARNERVVFTNGCFDLLHVGHVSYLQEAKSFGATLVVGVNSDASVRRLKGSSRPVIQSEDRASMLAALSCVDYVVVFEEDTPREVLQALQPDVLVKGGTYQIEEVVGHEIVHAYGGEVRVTGVVEGISTSKILASLGSGGRGPHFDAALAHARRNG